MLSAADRRVASAWKILAIVNVFATVLMTNQACAVRESSEGINMPPIQHHSVPSAAAAAVDQVRWIRNNRPDRRHLFSVRKSFNTPRVGTQSPFRGFKNQRLVIGQYESTSQLQKRKTKQVVFDWLDFIIDQSQGAGFLCPRDGLCVRKR